jgi:hypothetical protein
VTAVEPDGNLGSVIGNCSQARAKGDGAVFKLLPPRRFAALRNIRPPTCEIIAAPGI